MIVREKLKGEPLEWKVDTCQFLKEVLECGNPKLSGMAIFQKPFMIFKSILAEVADRAIKLDDPAMNILMLRLMLYECPPSEIDEQINFQKNKLKLKEAGLL